MGVANSFVKLFLFRGIAFFIVFGIMGIYWLIAHDKIKPDNHYVNNEVREQRVPSNPTTYFDQNASRFDVCYSCHNIEQARLFEESIGSVQRILTCIDQVNMLRLYRCSDKLDPCEVISKRGCEYYKIGSELDYVIYERKLKWPNYHEYVLYEYAAVGNSFKAGSLTKVVLLFSPDTLVSHKDGFFMVDSLLLFLDNTLQAINSNPEFAKFVKVPPLPLQDEIKLGHDKMGQALDIEHFLVNNSYVSCDEKKTSFIAFSSIKKNLDSYLIRPENPNSRFFVDPNSYSDRSEYHRQNPWFYYIEPTDLAVRLEIYFNNMYYVDSNKELLDQDAYSHLLPCFY